MPHAEGIARASRPDPVRWQQVRGMRGLRGEAKLAWEDLWVACGCQSRVITISPGALASAQGTSDAAGRRYLRSLAEAGLIEIRREDAGAWLVAVLDPITSDVACVIQGDPQQQLFGDDAEAAGEAPCMIDLTAEIVGRAAPASDASAPRCESDSADAEARASEPSWHPPAEAPPLPPTADASGGASAVSRANSLDSPTQIQTNSGLSTFNHFPSSCASGAADDCGGSGGGSVGALRPIGQIIASIAEHISVEEPEPEQTKQRTPRSRKAQDPLAARVWRFDVRSASPGERRDLAVEVITRIEAEYAGEPESLWPSVKERIARAVLHHEITLRTLLRIFDKLRERIELGTVEVPHMYVIRAVQQALRTEGKTW